jgi:arylsulfatase
VPARNLLFLWTDEQRPDTIGAYHHPRAPLRGRTPHTDRLAAGGALFEQAYCAEPLCTPSRATVLTGVYPHAHGAIHNNVPLPRTYPTIAELLRPHGYACGYAGKWHLGDELRPQRGFDWWSSIEDEYTHDHRAEGYSSYHRWLVAHGVTPPDVDDDGSPVFSRLSAAQLPEHLGKPAFLAQEARRFLDEHAGSTEGAAGARPFALYVNFLEPHFPLRGPWDDLFFPGDVRLPDTWQGPPDAGMPLRYRLRRDGFAAHNPHVGTDDVAGWTAAIARYWGLASLVDKYVGQILDHLEALGLVEDTIVVYSSDHGDMMGEHRLIAKAMPYEASARVPLLLRGPGIAPQRVAAPVSQVDLVPTLLDLLGIAAPAHVQGESLAPVLRAAGPGATVGRVGRSVGPAGARNGDTASATGTPEARVGAAEREVVIEWHGVDRGKTVSGYRAPHDDGSAEAETILRAMGAQHRCIRLGPWKLTVDESGEHELYNLETDPGEAHNLLGPGRSPSAESAEAARRLWERLLAWQQRTGDTLSLPAPL